MSYKPEPLINNQVTRNKYVWLAVLFCIVALLSAYFIPVLAEVLAFQPLGFREWVLIVIASALPTIIIQSIKLIKEDF